MPMYTRLVEFSPDAMFVNCGGKIVYANPATAHMLGRCKADDLIGCDPLSFVRSDFHDEIRRRMEATLSTGLPNPPMEQVWMRQDGAEIVVSVVGVRFEWEGQPAIEVCGRDITEQKRLQHEAEEARRDAEHASMSKSRLVSAVSHDLRQPLQSLTLFASVIEADRNLSPQSRVALEHLRVSIGRMGDLLGAILSIARIEAGLVRDEKKPVPLDQLLSDLAEEMAPQAHAKKLALKFVPTSLVVEGDPTLLTTILRNLVANAIRYTERGKVLIGVRRQGDECVIAVYDTGAGIDPDKLHLIWEEFYQVNNEARDSSLGLGLGLSIVQRLTRLLGYKVLVKSVRGKGSAFCIVMPTLPS